jgi:hypothetical protein
MKWIVHVHPTLDPRIVGDALLQDDATADIVPAPVFITRDSIDEVMHSTLESLELAIPPITTAVSGTTPTAAMNVACVVSVGSNAVTPLASMNHPVRLMVDKLLSDLRAATAQLSFEEFDDDGAAAAAESSTKAAWLANVVVAVAVNSFASATELCRSRALAPLLVANLATGDAVPASSPGSPRRSHLAHPFRARARPTDSHVEIRDVSEFDALVRELLRSSSFRDASSRVTLCVNVGAFWMPPEGSSSLAHVSPVVLASASHWHLWAPHCDAFTRAVKQASSRPGRGADAMLGLGDTHAPVFSPFDAPMDITVGVVMVDHMDACVVGRRLMAAVDTIAAPLPSVPVGDPSSPRSGRATTAAVAPAAAPATDMPTAATEFLRSLQAEKVRLVASIADADAEIERLSAVLDEAERLELAQREADHLVEEHDEADSTFAILLQRLKNEKDERRRIEIDLEKERGRLQKAATERRAAVDDAQRATIDLQMAEATLKAEQDALRVETAELAEAEEAATAAKVRAAEMVATSQSRLESEQARLMEARVRAIESTNAHLDKTQELSAAERRGRIDALERELTRLRHRVEHTQTEKRGLQATLIELQAKIALELESARGEDRAAKLASAEWDNLRRKWGEDVSADRVRSLDGEVAAVQAELAQVAAQRESVRARLADAERACESAEAELADSHRRHATSEVEAQADVDALFRMALSSLLRVEGQQRDVVALQCATATDELAIEERASWDAALRATEGLVHEAGHSHTRREITAGTSRVSVIHDRILASKTRFEIFEARIAKSQAQHNAIVAEYHEQHRQLLEEEKAEELNRGDDSRTPEEAMLALELEHATRDSQRKARAIRNALARAPVDPLASARPVVLPSLADIYKRLQRLLRDARRRAQDADAETSNTDRTLRRVSREIDERSEIRSRVRSAATRYEARIEELEAHLTRASMALDSRAHRDNALREQLKLEYHEAQELLSRHRREDEQRLRESYEAIDELRGQVQQSTAQVQSLRQELAMAKRRNTPANEEICRAELRFESERARELDALLAEAMARTQGAAARRTPVDAAFESAAAHSLRSSRAPSSIDHSSASASVIAEELGSD